ncbi:amidohydrolase [Rheinheimera sp. MM224]|uniref:amidohydrolase n=1 Tax=Rheinheimera sp. MM224 TaxID=3019969 RepID=UPI0021F8D14C|nr:amidohydrolase [Rheinheimera sp. MM224]CAI3790718.1 Omega-amidase YafV [Rheinheimera sp. MM224]
MSVIHVALIQSELVWQDSTANRQNLEQQIQQHKGAQLFVLPEMFNTGFSMDSTTIAETMEGLTVQWMQQQAKLADAALCGSVAISAEGQIFNRLLFVTPDGLVRFYDKRHLFRMGGEQQHYQAGSERVIVSYLGFRFCLQVCYDLRFPVFARNQQDYDVLIYVANWPEPRRQVWRTLLQARAIENQAYVLGCNRIGSDGNSLNYSGDSMVVNYLGQIQAELSVSQAGVVSTELNLSALQQFKQKFPAYLDADPFVLTPSF